MNGWTPAASASDALVAGAAALRGGAFDRACDLLAAAPEIASDPEAAYRLGTALALAGRIAEAAAAWRATLRLDALHPGALYDLGVACVQLGDDGAAARAFTRLLDAHPDHAEGRFNLGNLLFRNDAAEDAVAVYAPLTAAEPPMRGALVNLGRALRRLGRLDEADACYRRALLIDPDDHVAHWNRAHVLFLTGRWAEGFAAWEHRLAAGFGPPIAPSLPEWQGGPPPATLLAVAEQGHGDAIQCLRYLPELLARGCRPSLAIHPALVELVRTLLPQVEVRALADFGSADAWAPLFSLPHRLGLPNPRSVAEPAASPAFAAGIAAFADAAPRRRRRIGVAWAGNPHHDNDRWRSMRWDDLAPLLGARPDLDWVSLQAGETAADAPPAPPMPDFAATARAIAGLDLVIAVDTAVAHLAATLGVPTWLLLAAEPDWRWGQSGATTPWYASARLFRQTRLGDWRPVLRELAGALASLPAQGGE